MATLSSFYNGSYAWKILFLAIATISPRAMSSDVATYIVHMNRAAMPRAFQDHSSWFRAALASTATTKSASLTPLYTYNTAIHGFSARLSSSHLSRIRNLPGFIAAYEDTMITLDTTHSFEFLGLNPGAGLWKESRLGEGVIVGVVDSGVWPESESFKDDGMPDVPAKWRGACVEGPDFNSSACNKKLIGARYFNKGLLAAAKNFTALVNSARDTDGHGTHTSATAAGNYVTGASFFGYGNGTARGMAPRSHLAVYKAVWKDAGVASDLLAAIDAAISDGVDVLSLSVSIGLVPLYRDPVAISAFAAMEKGIFVAASAGNLGPSTLTLHNGAPWLLTVGATDLDREFSGTVKLGNGKAIVGASLYVGATSINKSPLVFADACDNNTALNLAKDKIVVCEALTFFAVSFAVATVRAANISAAIFITPRSYNTIFLAFDLAGAFVSPADGSAILDYVKRSENPTATIRFRETVLGGIRAPAVPLYSARGPSRGLPAVLKPDLMAPGTMILASWPANSPIKSIGSGTVFSSFNVISGTSMACPHAAGVAALLKAVHSTWSPAAIRSAMMTTADWLNDAGELIKDLGVGGTAEPPAATPFALGSGQVNPNNALNPGLVYDAGAVDYVNLLCAANLTGEQIMAITRSSGEDCSRASLDLNYPSFLAYFSSNETMLGENASRVFRRTLTNVAEGSWSYHSSFNSMEGIKLQVEPQTLVFREKNEKQSFTLRVEVSKGMDEDQVVHGALTWIDSLNQHVVRSPVVVTTLVVLPLS
ncbi:subtilisin-like protease SBT3 [Wolffia australiana]